MINKYKDYHYQKISKMMNFCLIFWKRHASLFLILIMKLIIIYCLPDKNIYIFLTFQCFFISFHYSFSIIFFFFYSFFLFFIHFFFSLFFSFFIHYFFLFFFIHFFHYFFNFPSVLYQCCQFIYIYIFIIYIRLYIKSLYE